MEFPESELYISEPENLGLGLMLDQTADMKPLLTSNDDEGSCQNAGDICKEFSPTTSECFANLPLFGECSLELSQDCCCSDLSEKPNNSPTSETANSSPISETANPSLISESPINSLSKTSSSSSMLESLGTFDPVLTSQTQGSKGSIAISKVKKMQKLTKKGKGKINIKCKHRARLGDEIIKNIKLRKYKNISSSNSTDDKPYKCPTCGKGFSHNSNATSHQKRHGEKAFKCQQCEKTFALSVNYEAHLRSHNGIKPYNCAECGKSFSWSGGYHRHQRIHSGVKPYVCTDCGKEFSDIGNYNNHRRIHTGERPHVCGKCGKCFSRSDSLNRHMITHSHLKMFECTHCGQEFKHLESLNKHCKRVHEGLKPLRREECLIQNRHVMPGPKRVRTKV